MPQKSTKRFGKNSFYTAPPLVTGGGYAVIWFSLNCYIRVLPLQLHEIRPCNNTQHSISFEAYVSKLGVAPSRLGLSQCYKEQQYLASFPGLLRLQFLIACSMCRRPGNEASNTTVHAVELRHTEKMINFTNAVSVVCCSRTARLGT